MQILSSDISLVDTHCHLDMDAYQKDLVEVLTRAEGNGVRQVITIGIDLQSSEQAIRLALTYPALFATVGVHPHDVDNITNQTYSALTELIENNRECIVGYGEIGLDYVKKYSLIKNQKDHFRRQIEIAKNFNLPVIIHDREAHDDTLSILSETGLPQAGGVMHCFSGDIDLARKVLDLGMYISIPGVVTFKNAQPLQEVARTIPWNRFLLKPMDLFSALIPKEGNGMNLHMFYTLQLISQIYVI